MEQLSPVGTHPVEQRTRLISGGVLITAWTVDHFFFISLLKVFVIFILVRFLSDP
jgi:hypothetical protein